MSVVWLRASRALGVCYTRRASDNVGLEETDGAAGFVTPAQAADMLEVSTATLRRYSRQFSEHLSESAKAKRRRYTQDDLGMLARARDLLRQGTPVERANSLLRTLSPDTNDRMPVAATMSHVELVAAFSEGREILRSISERLANLEQAQAASIETQAANIETIESLQERLWWLQTRSFIDRLLNRDMPQDPP